jgi:hypothetical protein
MFYINANVLKSELQKIQNKIWQLEAKKDDYDFGTEYKFNKNLDRLYIYQQFENLLIKLQQNNDEILKTTSEVKNDKSKFKSIYSVR